ncbi:MAG: hypothetical protein Q7S43_03805 [bacterium]|nr:hypothetical protein [bacterium]
MGFILRTERRAVESVFQKNLISLKPGQRYFLENKELFFIGVSMGIGTCSDLHGINIALFQEVDNQLTTIPLITCAGAVLVRDRRDNEPTKWLYPAQISICRITEGIRTTRMDGHTIYFESSRTTNIYVPLE